ncbi:hypothetical protein HT594_00137 [Phenacoccus solenopsis nudivirus]|nr:hypothetical protein HT594_00137 [Phenacoccus solenopsis nudivirus]
MTEAVIAPTATAATSATIVAKNNSHDSASEIVVDDKFNDSCCKCVCVRVLHIYNRSMLFFPKIKFHIVSYVYVFSFSDCKYCKPSSSPAPPHQTAAAAAAVTTSLLDELKLLRENPHSHRRPVLCTLLGKSSAEYARVINSHPKSYMRKRLLHSGPVCAFKLLVQRSNLSFREIRVAQLSGTTRCWSLECNRQGKSLPPYEPTK